MIDQRGNASIAVLGFAGVVAVLLLGLADLGVFLMARAKAQTAADAAALAAAAELLPGQGSDPVVEATRYAELNGAVLIFCDCKTPGRQATVSAAVPVRFALLGALGIDRVRARARAEADLGSLGRSPPPG